MGKGKLIVFEGLDGSGKTTQALLLVEALKAKGFKACYTCEPTYWRVGDLLRLHVSRLKRRSPVYEALLFAADRYEHAAREVRPKLRRGYLVVSDRYLHSSLAYQGASGLSLQWIKRINFFAPKPDAVIFLDVPAEEALKRKLKGKRSGRGFESLSFQRKVRKVYLKMAEEEGFLTFDALKPVDELHREILGEVLKLLKGR
ncbi:MAG: dTMP kinase [Candidatus Hecatellaceae archaeon]